MKNVDRAAVLRKTLQGPTRSGERARFLGRFSEMRRRALNGWMLARAPASPAESLHSRHGPRYYNFSYLCITCGLEKVGLVRQN